MWVQNKSELLHCPAELFVVMSRSFKAGSEILFYEEWNLLNPLVKPEVR